MSDVIFDLLGDPVPEGFGKRGRPQHVPTDEKRMKVRVLCAFTPDLDDVAAGIGVSVPTLKRYYFRELREKGDARKRLKATLLYRLMEGAEQGNATSIDKLFKRIDKMEVAELSEVVKGRGGREVPKGKKEAARDAAAEVAGIFSPRQAPPRTH